jgi:hypothetical protein
VSAAAVVPIIVDGDGLIARAKAILAENRSITAAEQQAFRDGLYHLGQRGDVLAHDMLKLVTEEIDRRAEERTRNAIIATSTSAIAARVERDRGRPQRWAALSPMRRAAFLMDDGTELGKAFARFALLAEDERTAQLAPPRNFEPESY